MCLGNTQVKMRIISRISFLGQKKMPIVHESKIRLLVISEDTLSEYSKKNVCVCTLCTSNAWSEEVNYGLWASVCMLPAIESAPAPADPLMSPSPVLYSSCRLMTMAF